MPIYCLEMRSTADWSDVRYREYTTSVRKAEAFRNIPKIKFTDNGHGIVPVVKDHIGRREKPISILRDHVASNLKAG
jgi:hypothetical protein